MKKHLSHFILLPILICSIFKVDAFAGNRVSYVYVSTSGNDKNAGTEQAPLKSIGAAIKYNMPIKLKRGDTFYESVNDNGCNILAYGNGNNPKICGWKSVPANKDLWEEGKLLAGKWYKSSGTKIWRIDLENQFATGRLSGHQYLNNIGIIINTTTNESFGNKCEFLYMQDCKDPYASGQTNTYLKHEMDFWQSSKNGKAKFASDDFRYLYIFSSNDPNQYAYRFSTYGNGFSLSNARVEEIDVEGFGCHGFGCGSNAIVLHCNIDYVGGSQQIGANQWVRFGNGVEFYGPRENGEVAYNTISHTFDCATTIQGNCGDSTYAKNIVFHNNEIHNCRQAFEFFWRKNKKTGFYHDVENCAFESNVCTDNGHNNGFRAPDWRDTHILTYHTEGKTSVEIKNNKFIGGTGFISGSHPEFLTFGKNSYELANGAILWNNYRGKGDIVYKKDNAKECIAAFHKKVGTKKLKIENNNR